jgi:hypothetical protein
MKPLNRIFATALIFIVVALPSFFVARKLSRALTDEYFAGVIKISKSELIVNNATLCSIVINSKDGYEDYPDSMYKHNRKGPEDHYLPKVLTHLRPTMEKSPGKAVKIFIDTSHHYVMLPPVIKALQLINVSSVEYHDSKNRIHVLYLDSHKSTDPDDVISGFKIEAKGDSLTVVYGNRFEYESINRNITLSSRLCSPGIRDSINRVLKSRGPEIHKHDSIVWLDIHPKTTVVEFESILSLLNVASDNRKFGLHLIPIPHTLNPHCCTIP